MKIKSEFVCEACGYKAAKWLGKCPDCGEWNSFSEEKTSKALEQRKEAGLHTLASGKPLALSEIDLDKTPRYLCHIPELDRVLGGGIVPGSLILLGGDPGIGKSTLVLQVLDNLVSHNVPVLYATGEESQEQIKMRADRLGVQSNIMVVAENSLEKIMEYAENLKPQVIVIDSIQTVYQPHLESAPGTVSQVRECAAKLLYFSKSTGTSTFLIGHVTKDGAIAGPRLLEHMVDNVLYFEGENTGQFRILRTIKNRYGSTNEIGVFEMTSLGLKEVSNPSAHFLRDKTDQSVGSCITAAIEGTRPILAEIQSLVSSSSLTNPRRTCIGTDTNRVALLIAVLEKAAGINLYNQDIYVNVVGGLKITEPAIDLAILLSLLSSFKNKALPANLVAFGEVGLNGEIRPIAFADKRLQEAVKMGYKTLVLPSTSKINKSNNTELIGIKTVRELLDRVL